MAEVPTYNGFKRVTGSTTSRLKVVSGAGGGTAAQDRFYIGAAALTTEGANPAAILFGYGNATTRAVSSDANGKFISFYTEGNGDGQYGAYFRHYVSTAALSNDCLRAFGTVNNVAAATVRGAHISLSFGTTGTVTGLGAALEATLHIPNQATQTGTLYAVKAAINSDGATSDPAGATTLAYYAAVNQGDTTGDDDVDTDAVLIDVQGHATGTGTLFQTVTTAYTLGEITNSLKIKVGGTIHHLLASTTGAQAT